MKKMKISKYFFLGLLGGITFAVVEDNPALLDMFTKNIEKISYFLLGCLSVFLIRSLIFSQQLKALHKKELQGEEEDKKDEMLNEKYCDTVLSTTIAFALATLNECIVFLKTDNEKLLFMSSVLLIVSAFFSAYSYRLAKYVNPEREYPKYFDPELPQKLFTMMDEGEKHVMVSALYKVWNIVNAGLIICIISAAGFSYLTDTSQLFSIGLFTCLFLSINTVYLLSTRRKYEM